MADAVGEAAIDLCTLSRRLAGSSDSTLRFKVSIGEVVVLLELALERVAMHLEVALLFPAVDLSIGEMFFLHSIFNLGLQVGMWLVDSLVGLDQKAGL